MVDSTVKDKNGVNSRVQFQKDLSSTFSKAVNLVQDSVSKLRMYAVRNPGTPYEDFNFQLKEISFLILMKI